MVTGTELELRDEEISLEWAETTGEPMGAQFFSCPKCGLRGLSRTEMGVEFSQEVVAVCEPETRDGFPIVALGPLRDIFGGNSFRYSCSCGYELVKDDGAPVQSPEELLAWLKAH